MKRLALLTVLVAFSAAAHAAPEIYVIDNSQTSSQFSFNSLGGSSQTHKFDKVSGKVVFDPVSRTGTAEVNIDASSVNTGHRIFNHHLQSTSFFDTANHPTITFKSSKAVLDGEENSMAGELTIKGVTLPVTLAISGFQCEQDATYKVESCGANATVTVKRSDFNMGKFTFLAIKAVKMSSLIQLASRDIGK